MVKENVAIGVNFSPADGSTTEKIVGGTVLRYKDVSFFK